MILHTVVRHKIQAPIGIARLHNASTNIQKDGCELPSQLARNRGLDIKPVGLCMMMKQPVPVLALIYLPFAQMFKCRNCVLQANSKDMLINALKILRMLINKHHHCLSEFSGLYFTLFEVLHF